VPPIPKLPNEFASRGVIRGGKRIGHAPENDGENFYILLGITPRASDGEIRAAILRDPEMRSFARDKSTGFPIISLDLSLFHWESEML
jgi:hypothetical protein